MQPHRPQGMTPSLNPFPLPPHTWTLAPTITFEGTPTPEGPHGSWLITLHWTPTHYITKRVYSPLEFTTFLEALGSGRISPRTETVEEALSRGLTITKLRPGHAAGLTNLEAKLGRVAAPEAKPKAKRNAATLTLAELLESLGDKL